MDTDERRSEQRLRYHWPVWFAEDFNAVLTQGQMVDVSSGGASFTCHVGNHCPSPEEQVTARFSVPRLGEEDSFDMANFTRIGRICRVEDINSYTRRVAIQFHESLPFRPGEQAVDNPEAQQSLRAVTA